MANEAMDLDPFDEFMNLDPDLYSPAAGQDMQGVGTRETGEDGCGHDTIGLHSLDDACEIGPQKLGCLREPDATQSGLVISSPSMLSDLHEIDSERSSSASNASTGPPPKALHIQPCACISCVEIGWFGHPMTYAYHSDRGWARNKYQCRYPGCQVEEYFRHITDHERSHFRVEDQYPCAEEHCNFATERWADFKRHSGSKHCTRPAKQFSCPVLWCKYSGSNGFARKDKLNSHCKTVHSGMTMPGKANQHIKPKVIGGT